MIMLSVHLFAASSSWLSHAMTSCSNVGKGCAKPVTYATLSKVSNKKIVWRSSRLAAMFRIMKAALEKDWHDILSKQSGWQA